jgi:hypothetical protein
LVFIALPLDQILTEGGGERVPAQQEERCLGELEEPRERAVELDTGLR